MNKSIEEQVEELCRHDNHVSGDSGNSNKYAIKKLSLRKALQERDRIAREEERERVLGLYHSTLEEEINVEEYNAYTKYHTKEEWFKYFPNLVEQKLLQKHDLSWRRKALTTSLEDNKDV